METIEQAEQRLHIMVDLETFGIERSAPILAIGAVRFDPHDETVPMDKFYCPVSLASCVRNGLVMEPGTVLWWMHEDQDKARRQLLSHEEPELLPVALDAFAEWYNQVDYKCPIWGNSASFDLGIMQYAYAKCNYAPPWPYWAERCYRTIKNIEHDTDKVLVGTLHNALDDAASQAATLQAIHKQTGIRFN